MSSSILARWGRFLLITLVLPIGAVTASAQTEPPVTARQDEKNLTLDNGLLALTFSKQSGKITSIISRLDGKETIIASGKTVAALRIPSTMSAP